MRVDQARWREVREAMVQQQLEARGISQARLLKAMRSVPRERFVPAVLSEFAYDDAPLPIDQHQTISQPFMVALMTQALELEPDDRVLEIGTGSGYAAAVLAEMASDVYTIERHQGLADAARARLAALGYDNVQVRSGDGTQGWPEQAPFDGIVVTAGGPGVPPSLRQQLAIGGYLVIPVGDAERVQTLLRVRRTGETSYAEEQLGAVRFVPLIGAEGWRDQDEKTESRGNPDTARSAPPRPPRSETAVADVWGVRMPIMHMRPAHAASSECLCHLTAIPRFLLPLTHHAVAKLRDVLTPARLERAIGVIYRPETERTSDYVHASLPRQDEGIWFDASRAVEPLPVKPDPNTLPEIFPFGPFGL